MEQAEDALSPGMVWVQASTIGGHATEALAGWAADRGVVFVDAPVQGTKQPAENGALVVLASAPEEVRDDAVAGVFDAIGSKTVWVSESPGDASRLKLALNVWVAALTHGVAETLAVAESLGVDLARVVEVVSGGPMDSGFFQAKAEAIRERNFAASFTVSNAVKDAALVLDAVDGSRVSLDVTQAAHARWLRAQQQGRGDLDMVASFLTTPESA